MTDGRGSRDPWFWGALVVAVLALGLGYALKSPCLDVSWDGSQFREGCYNDLQVIYAQRGLAEDRMPYVEAWNEYPVVSGLWMYVTALLTDDMRGFFVLNAIGLGLLALLSTVLLYSLVEDKRRVFLFAAAPSLVLYAFHNWDLLSVAAAIGGWAAYRKGRFAAAGALFAVGASAKIWPGLFLVFVGLSLLRGQVDDRRWSWTAPVVHFTAGGLATLVVLHVPFLLLNTSLYIDGYAWHLGRGPTFESHWHVLRHWTSVWSWDTVHGWLVQERLPLLTKLLMFAGMAVLAVATWLRRLGPLEATFGGLMVFLLTNQVWSVQYILWVLPFLVLIDRIHPLFAVALFAADWAVYWTIWPFFVALGTPDWVAAFTRLSWAVAARAVMLLALFVLVLTWAAGVRWQAIFTRWGGQGDARAAGTGPPDPPIPEGPPTQP